MELTGILFSLQVTKLSEEVPDLKDERLTAAKDIEILRQDITGVIHLIIVHKIAPE